MTVLRALPLALLVCWFERVRVTRATLGCGPGFYGTGWGAPASAGQVCNDPMPPYVDARQYDGGDNSDKEGTSSLGQCKANCAARGAEVCAAIVFGYGVSSGYGDEPDPKAPAASGSGYGDGNEPNRRDGTNTCAWCHPGYGTGVSAINGLTLYPFNCTACPAGYTHPGAYPFLTRRPRDPGSWCASQQLGAIQCHSLKTAHMIS